MLANRCLRVLQTTYDLMVERSFSYIIFQFSVQWTYKSCRWKKWIEFFVHKATTNSDDDHDNDVCLLCINFQSYIIIRAEWSMIKFNIDFHDRHLRWYVIRILFEQQVWTDWDWSSFCNVTLLYTPDQIFWIAFVVHSDDYDLTKPPIISIR